MTFYGRRKFAFADGLIVNECVWVWSEIKSVNMHTL